MFILKNGFKKIKKDFVYREDYFHYCRERIALTNIHLLRNVSVMTFFIIILMEIITHFTSSSYSITPSYFIMLFTPFPFYFFARYYENKAEKSGKINYKIVLCACMSFYIVLELFLIYISAVHPISWNSTQVYISLSFMFIPVLFIIPQTLGFIFMVLANALFLVLSYRYKVHYIFMDDVFSIIAAMVFSQGTAFFVWKIRISEYTVRRKLEHLSRIDRLTGILNKSTFEEECRSYFMLRPAEESCTLLVLDVDNFKKINDKYGHIIGDELLEVFGHGLLTVFRAADVVGRIGGDEFCVLIKSFSDPDVIKKKIEKIHEYLNNIISNKANIEVSCSIGIAQHICGVIVYRDLFKKADSALYKAKNTGKNKYVIYGEPV